MVRLNVPGALLLGVTLSLALAAPATGVTEDTASVEFSANSEYQAPQFVDPAFDPSAPAYLDMSDGTQIPISIENRDGSYVPVLPDGTSLEVGDTLSTAQARSIEGAETPAPGVVSAAACSWTNFVWPGTGATYTSSDGCGLIGFDIYATHYYEWQKDAFSSGRACNEGRGYKKIRNATSYSVYWAGLGCGTSGAATVSIGEVITVAKIRGSAPSAPIGVAGVFR